MSNVISPDPSRGFVALPLEVLEIEMSPGAFRTLVEFCRMADSEGVCWPSLEQLGARLSRSRAAVSGYVRELRELDLVETETQRTANGFNYRLRFRVTFWRGWKARFRRTSDLPKSERSVHSFERKNKKNQIHENQPPSRSAGGGGDPLVLNTLWARHIADAPYPEFSAPPDPNLLAQTRACVARHATISADMTPPLTEFFSRRDIFLSPETTADLAAEAARIASVPDAPALLVAALQKAWRPHWTLPPTRAFLARVIDRIAAEHPGTLAARLLAGNLRRWEACGKSLRRAA